MQGTQTEEVGLFAAECLRELFQLHEGEYHRLLAKSNLAKMGTMLVHSGEELKGYVLTLLQAAVHASPELKVQVRRHLVLSQAILSAAADPGGAYSQQLQLDASSASGTSISSPTRDLRAA